MLNMDGQKILVVVAAPVEETLWCGGYLLMQNRGKNIEIVTLTTPNTHAQKLAFERACMAYGAQGVDLGVKDTPERQPLDPVEIAHSLARRVNFREYDTIFTHNKSGEYTSNRRHKELYRAVNTAIETDLLACDHLARFCYTDNDGVELPHPKKQGAKLQLNQELWQKKYVILRKIYNYTADSWEARTTPKTESFLLKTAKSSDFSSLKAA